ncbi:hypothetical protein SteCoe_23792 [Stentor coeruleus]|uniref:Ubiquitin-like domain-containing protein n=1 Tax=Stentor coeruleus TaxID=5963 RepID=A0A1R2BJ31_9CILI|nr:hypothetical protein SteCoe_23792 [Stentor coeruleus]
MRIILKPRNNEVDFPRTAFDVEPMSTPDHLISHLTLKYNVIDATTLVLYYKGIILPFDQELFKLNIHEDEEIEVGIKKKPCCCLL